MRQRSKSLRLGPFGSRRAGLPDPVSPELDRPMPGSLMAGTGRPRSLKSVDLAPRGNTIEVARETVLCAWPDGLAFGTAQLPVVETLEKRGLKVFWLYPRTVNDILDSTSRTPLEALRLLLDLQPPLRL